MVDMNKTAARNVDVDSGQLRAIYTWLMVMGIVAAAANVSALVALIGFYFSFGGWLPPQIAIAGCVIGALPLLGAVGVSFPFLLGRRDLILRHVEGKVWVGNMLIATATLMGLLIFAATVYD